MNRKPSLLVGLTAAASALLLAAALLPVGMPVSAQAAATAVPTFSGPTNAVQGNMATCDTDAVINLRGTLLAGYDVYFQLFSGTTGSGTAISSVRQVSASGDFTFSERVPYNAGTTVAVGQSASAKVTVAREGNPAAVDFDFVMTDANDGCTAASAQPQFTLGTSTDTGATGGTGTTTTNVNLISLPSPFGGVLNPNLAPETAVVIGPRPSDLFRSETPGLIYAACNNFPLALPGIVYDNDNIIVYWSWFTRTLEQMDQHLANVNYSVRMNSATFNDVVRSEPQRINGDYYVFYTVDVGNLRPGHYEVEYRATWNQPVFDGYDDYGPGTDLPQDAGNCNFDVQRNPTSQQVSYTDMFLPSTYPVHNITPDN